MSKMWNQNFENSALNETRPLGEGSPSGEGFLVKQREFGLHQVTANGDIVDCLN